MTDIMRNKFLNGEGAIHFESVNELESLAGYLDTAELVPIYAHDSEQEDLIEVQNKRGVLNRGTGEVASVVSDTYRIIQHSDAIKDLTAGIRLSGHEVAGALYNYNDGIMVRYLMSDIEPISDISAVGNIYTGSQVVNSYDKTSSFKGSAFLVRQVCSNGMCVSEMIKDTNFSIYHTVGSIGKIEDAISRFTVGMIENVQSRLGEVIVTAMDSRLAYQSRDDMIVGIAGVIGAQVHAENIVSRANLNYYDTDRWSVYNAVTEYASHDDELTDSVRNKIINVASKILYPTTTLIPAPVEV